MCRCLQGWVVMSDRTFPVSLGLGLVTRTMRVEVGRWPAHCWPGLGSSASSASACVLSGHEYPLRGLGAAARVPAED